MDSKQLRYFVAVAEELHFGKAAKRLNMSQPPLSQHIIKFEEELETKLFSRNKRSVTLTAAGKSLLEDARRILRLTDLAEEKLKATAQGRAGTLTLSYVAPALDTDLPLKIGRYKTDYPEVKLSLLEMKTFNQLDEIRKGSVDAGIVRLFRHNTEGLAYDLFHSESYALIIPAGHRFESKKSVNIAELAGEKFIFAPRRIQSALYDEWLKIFSEAGFIPDIVQEAESKNTALALVRAGLGISIVPESLSMRSSKEVIFKKLSGPIPDLELHIAYLESNENPALRNFLTTT
ncbi:LysR substrate-binding domain-containing protein [Maridesulfovibrio bastinii]|uniref:LysR substrate-binding domain-containing protein n=1 Tax=Maridesulfovibrio bastinii TaxID=47157 RepID=UPI0003F7C435|nr:LysR substrate-binding domain-containing protein [Maridesulfovibrio bastinii]